MGDAALTPRSPGDSRGAELPCRVAHYLDWSDKGRSTFVRYALGLVVIALALFLLGGLAALPVMLWSRKILAGSVAGTVLSTTSAFLLVFVLVPLVTRVLLRRPWWSFGFARSSVDGWALGVAMGVSFGVSLLASLLFGALGLLTIRFQVPDFGPFLLASVVAVIGLFVQSSAEEFVFRGYLTQFVRRYTSHPVLFLGIPALLFSALHVGNVAAFGGAWTAVLPYLASALLFGWFAYRTGSLWMAIGLHWGNNLGNVILVGTDVDVLPTVAPIVVVQPTLAAGTATISVATLVTAVVLELLVRRRTMRARQNDRAPPAEPPPD